MSLLSPIRALLTSAKAAGEELHRHECLQHCQESPIQTRSSAKASGQIIVCRRTIQTDAKVINWQDAPSFSAYYRCCYQGPDGARLDPHPYRPAQGMENRTARYRPRKELLGQPGDLQVLQQIIRQLVIHHDGADSSAECFHILHDERGLSVHFLIDTDGTIYQTLDLADIAFHAQTVNGVSIGIELCNRGLVALPCSVAHRQRRDPRTATIHGQTYRMWSFTDAQYASLAQLTAELVRIFPRLPLCFPRSGGPIFTKLTEPEQYSGLLGHYHVSAQKWDPGCFDFPRLLGTLPGRRLFGLAPAPRAATSEAEPHAELLRAEAENPHGGFFPVGSCGTELVWHGGVHLALPALAPVPALLGGQIVAARIHRPGHAFGSTNFVLTRHDISVATRQYSFFVLYYHLSSSLHAEDFPAWRRRKQAEQAAQAALSSVEVFFPNVDILAGEVLGHVGVAGPPGSHEPQLHLEVFAAEEVSQALLPGRFRIKDCGEKGPLCSAAEVLSLFEGQPPRALFADALSGQNLGQKAKALRRFALRFPSEWVLRSHAEFDRGLRSTAAYRRAAPAARAAVYCEQALPAAWLTPRVAQKLELPEDFVLWHYHPVEFLSAIALREEPQRTTEWTPVQADTQAASGDAKDGVKSDVGYASAEDLAEWEVGTGIELTTEELAIGYPPHWLR